MASSVEYTCRLTEDMLKRAKEELNEDPKNRMGAVETFRKWILDQKHFTCPTDTEFLLAFLRHRKFSQLEARKQLERFLSRRSKLTHLFQNYDTGDPEFLKLVDTKVFVLLPGRDKQGRKVFIMRPGKMDATFKEYTLHQTFRVLGAFLDAVYFLDENTQVSGTVTIIDFSGYGMKHQTNIPLKEKMNVFQTWQGAYPARVKQLHLYNLGSFADAILTIIKLIMTEKVRSRLKQHGDNFETIYKEVPMEMLPEEYLPDDYEGPSGGTEAQIIENMKKMFTDEKNRAKIKYISSDQHKYEEKLKPSDVPQESFRKLNID